MPTVSKTLRPDRTSRSARRGARPPHSRSPIKLRAWWRTARHKPAVRRAGWLAGASVLVVFGLLAVRPVGGFERLGLDVAKGAARFGLKIERVTVRGRVHTDTAEILASLGIERGDPILGLDPHEARARLQALDWVAEAEVLRLLPDAVHVEITERHPFALWQRGKRLTVVDRTGRPITDRAVPQAIDLPLVVGEGAAEHAAALVSMLASEPDLYRRVRASVRVGGRRWNLRLDNGIDVRLPEQDPAAAWRRLARLQRQHRLLEREIRSVDLRMPDRLLVRLTESEAEARHEPGENT